MKIGIIGAGGIAQAVAKQALGAGYEVILSNSRGPETLKAVVQAPWCRCQRPAACAKRRRGSRRARSAMVERRQGARGTARLERPHSHRRDQPHRGPPDFKLADLGGKTSSQVVASLAPGARVVKAMNTLIVANLSADPREAGGRRVLFMSGDDAPAKKEVARCSIASASRRSTSGTLAIGGALQQFPGGPLPVHNLIKLG